MDNSIEKLSKMDKSYNCMQHLHHLLHKYLEQCNKLVELCYLHMQCLEDITNKLITYSLPPLTNICHLDNLLHHLLLEGSNSLVSKQMISSLEY